MIQYAPIIANTVPGFFENKVKIYFTHNQAVGNVRTMFLLIKDLDGTVINSTPIQMSSTIGINENLKRGEAVFPLGYMDGEVQKYMVTAGQYYKFQIAYSDTTSSDNLTYSSVSIGKCIGTTNKESSIISFVTPEEEIQKYDGIYEVKYQAPIVSELLYSYEFSVLKNNTIIETTDEIIYNNINNQNSTFSIVYEPRTVNGQKIQCKITTINGYTKIIDTNCESELEDFVNFDLDFKLNNCYDNGYIDISFIGSETGKYLVERTSDKEKWDKIYSFVVTEDNKNNLSILSYKDCAIEHGVTYTYVLRKYEYVVADMYAYSSRNNKAKQATIKANFEDIFLSDSERQLKIRFNPKVSSFKDTILEQKTDTIGGTYPFIFRNGQVRYKEIPISGLISYLMDEEELFMPLEELGLAAAGSETVETPGRSTNLTDINITAERKFKLEVLNWLTNGKPKLFRSPAEGNYIVRLMNVSLSPDDKLSRMLHTFSATGYEIADFSDYRNLVDKKIVPQIDKFR